MPDDKSRWIKGSRLIRHAVAMSMVATPHEDVEFCMVDETTGRKEIVKLTTRKGALYLPIDALRRMVCKTFQWGGCMIRSDDGACEIDTADDFNVVWTSYVIGEASRRRDVLEALLESIRAALNSTEVELNFQALHGLWELTCYETNQRYMTNALFDALTRMLTSSRLRLQSLATACIWELADNTSVSIRMPVGTYVPALLNLLIADQVPEPTQEAAKEALKACERKAQRAGSVMFLERICSTNLDEDGNEEPSEETQAARAVAGTGFSMTEQRIWFAGAVLSCMKIEPGRRAFQKAGAALRLLQLLEAPLSECSAKLKAACAALLSEAVMMSPPLCKVLVSGGLPCLVSLAGGYVAGDVGTRLQASELLKFCLARVKFHAGKPKDLQMLESLPRLIGELRAATKPLLLCLRNYTVKNVVDDAMAIDDCCMLLRNVTASMWAMMSLLASTRRPLPISPGVLKLVRKLLELAPGCNAFANERVEKLSATHGKQLRLSCLGMLASMEFQCKAPATQQSEQLRLSEESGFAAAAKRLVAIEKEEEIETEVAATRLQAALRGRLERRKAGEMEAPVAKATRRRSVAIKEHKRAPEDLLEVVHGPIQSRALASLRALAIELLAHLQRLMEEGEATTRVAECYAAALASMASMAEVTLLRENAIKRILTFYSIIKTTAGKDGTLTGYASRIHGYLSSMLLTIVSLDHPALGNVYVARSVADATILKRRHKATVTLSAEDLKSLIEHVGLSVTGGKVGAVVLWMQACLGSDELIGELGGAQMLCNLLEAAVNDHQLKGEYAAQATWVLCALWRLCFSAKSAAVVLECIPSTVLYCMAQTDHADLGSAALGCVNVILTLQRDLAPQLSEAGADEALNMLARSNNFAENERITATRTLKDVDDQNREGEQGQPDAIEASSLLDAADKTPATVAESGMKASLDGLFVALLADESLALRAVGSRGIARAAQRGAAACKLLVGADAPRRVMQVIKDAAKPVLIAQDADFTVYQGNTSRIEGANDEMLSSDNQNLETAEVAAREYELLYDAINAALNLSGSKVAQVPIARNGLWTLVELWYASQTFAWEGELQAIGEMAGETLTNLAANAENRTAMYRAELKLKSVFWSGGSLVVEPSKGAEIEQSTMQSSLPNAVPEAPPVNIDGDEKHRNAKQRYLDWIETIEAADKSLDDADAAAIASADAVDLENESHAVLLSRAAFALMDANGDGELSRLEMVRAFRLDERVRELLLPLLPLPTASKNSVTGIDLEEQISAFEALFKIMDSDGNDGVSKHEFEIFFRILDLKKKKDKGRAGAAAARRRLLQPPPQHGAERASDPLSAGVMVRGGSPRWPNARAGGPRPVSPRQSAAPRLDTLMRRNYYDTWRKPLIEQLPKPIDGGLKQRAPGRSPVTRTGLGSRGTLSTTSSVAKLTPLSGKLRANMRSSTSMPELKQPASTQKTSLPRLQSPTAAHLVQLAKTPSSRKEEVSSPQHAEGERGTWSPQVKGIEMVKPRRSATAAAIEEQMDLQPFERQYLANEISDQLLYKVDFPQDKEYTSRFAFTGLSDVKSGQSKGPSGKLVSWVGVPGSRVGDSVASPFTLPDGRVIRMFHTSCRRNARTPHPEQVERLPETLSALGMNALPARPFPVAPSERDVPRIVQTVSLLPPQPARSILELTHPPPRFGEIMTAPFELHVSEKAARAPTKLADDELSEEEIDRPLNLNSSIFALRKRVSDGHSYYTPPSLVNRAFHIDWSRCNTPRFRGLVGLEDDGGLGTIDVEMIEIREVLHDHLALIYGAYTYYCCLSELHDGFSLGVGAYFQFLQDIKAVDNESKYMNARALESIFVAANVEEVAKSFEERELNKANDDQALMRFEWIQCLVRIAIAKYVRDENSSEHIPDVSEAVSVFLENDVKPAMPKEATRDADTFRRARLYTRSVDAVFCKYQPALLTIYEYYSSVEGSMIQKDGVAPEPSMSLAEFECLLLDCGLLKTAQYSTVGITPVQMRLCLAWSKSFVTDELKRREKLTNANFVDFLEMIARLCIFLSLPTPELLEAYKVNTAAEFYESVSSGEHMGDVLTLWTDFTQPEWFAEESSQESLAFELELLINLILDRLDENGDGKIDKGDLAQRRKQMMQHSMKGVKRRVGSM